MRITVQAVRHQYARFLPWLMVTVGALFYCYEYLLRIAPSVMEIDLRVAFQLSATTFGSLSSFYYFSYTPMQLPVGLLMDRFGPRRLLMVACLFCALGSFVFASPGHLYVAKAGQLLIGFGSAFAFVGVLKIATIWLPPQRFALVSGLAVTLAMIGAMVGDLSLSTLVNLEGWRETSRLFAYLGIILTVIIYLVIRDKRTTGEKATPEPFIQKPKRTALEIGKEFLSLFANPYMWVNGIIGCLVFTSLSALAETWGVAFAETMFNTTKLEASIANSMIFLGWAFGAPFVGWLSDRIGTRRKPMIVGAIMATIFISLVLYVPNLDLHVIYALLFLFGFSTSVQVLVFAVGKELSPAHLAGSAVALTNMLVMMGGVIFKGVIGDMLDNHWDGIFIEGIRIYSATDYRYAVSIIPVCMFVGAVLAFFLKESYIKGTSHAGH